MELHRLGVYKRVRSSRGVAELHADAGAAGFASHRSDESKTGSAIRAKRRLPPDDWFPRRSRVTRSALEFAQRLIRLRRRLSLALKRLR